MINQTESLIGMNAQINLSVIDTEDYLRLHKPIPALPRVQGTFIRKIFSWTWCYIMKLSEPLLLDIDGINEMIRKSGSTKYVLITPAHAYSDDKTDNIFKQLIGKNIGKMRVIVSYIDNPTEVPSKLKTGEISDPFFKKMHSLSGGDLSLIK